MAEKTKETTDYNFGLISRRQLNKQLTNFKPVTSFLLN